MTEILLRIEDYILPSERDEHTGFFENLFTSTSILLKVTVVMMVIRYLHHAMGGTTF